MIFRQNLHLKQTEEEEEEEEFSCANERWQMDFICYHLKKYWSYFALSGYQC